MKDFIMVTPCVNYLCIKIYFQNFKRTYLRIENSKSYVEPNFSNSKYHFYHKIYIVLSKLLTHGNCPIDDIEECNEYSTSHR